MGISHHTPVTTMTSDRATTIAATRRADTSFTVRGKLNTDFNTPGSLGVEYVNLVPPDIFALGTQLPQFLMFPIDL
jgi:hypothetical protein